MPSESGETKGVWSCSEEHKGNYQYVVRSGGEIVGRVRTRGDADLICRSHRVAMQLGRRVSSDSQRHYYKIQGMRRDVHQLITGLAYLVDVLKRSSRPREIIAARERTRKLLMKMKSRGYS
jgi:hypothetical protein